MVARSIKSWAKFNRLITQLETYPEYKRRGDIVPIVYRKGEIISPEIMRLIEFTSYSPIMLISPNVKLTHKKGKADYLGGFLYLMNSDNRVKIGISENPNRRMAGIATSMGTIKYDVFISCYLDNARELEMYMHKHFNGSRIIGEWFNIDFLATIEFLKSCMHIDSSKRI